jgi:hypothetical protein
VLRIWHDAHPYFRGDHPPGAKFSRHSSNVSLARRDGDIFLRVYKTHRIGSRKGEIHRIFDKRGGDAAIAAAKRKGLKEATARTWASAWAQQR